MPFAKATFSVLSYTAGKGLLLAASSVTTASVASFLLGLVMLAVVAGVKE